MMRTTCSKFHAGTQALAIKIELYVHRSQMMGTTCSKFHAGTQALAIKIAICIPIPIDGDDLL